MGRKNDMMIWWWRASERKNRQTNKNVINFYNKKININEKETVEENCAVWYKLFLFCLLCSLSFYIFRIILLLINLLSYIVYISK